MYGIRDIFNTSPSEVTEILGMSSNVLKWLEMKDLEKLQKQYPFPEPRDYGEEGVSGRGKDNADRILQLVRTGQKSLELGCWDGMTSSVMQEKGIIATAIDNRSNGFDKRTKANLIKMDAAQLEFEDESFDFVFSFDCFEHFENPEKVMAEAYRVLKPKGRMYHLFQQMSSPFGLHAYSSITVPYCQFLFKREVLEEFIEKHGLDPIDYAQMNDWTLLDFKKLLEDYQDRLNSIYYKENIDDSYLNLVEKYPACFNGKIRELNELRVKNIETALIKK